MNDLISRQAAMAYPLSWEHYDMEHGDRKFICGVESYREYIEHLQSVDEWTPCSERLPKHNTPVVVTYVNHNPVSYYRHIKDKPFTGVGIYFSGKWFWYSNVTEDLLAEYGKCDIEEFDDAIEAVAWMPLPEPYKGGEE